MGAIARFLGIERREITTITGGPVATWDHAGLWAMFGRESCGSAAELAVTERCRSLISQTTASFPLPIYRRLPGGGREEATTHPLYRVLNDESSEGISAFELREAIARDVATTGNGYAEIIRDGRGAVSELLYIPAAAVSIEVLPNRRLRYRVLDLDGRARVLLRSEIVHIRYATRDGVIGIDPLRWARTSAGITAAQEGLARAQADKGHVGDLAFEMDALFDKPEVGEAAFIRLKNQLTERVAKMRGSIAPLLLEGGLKAKSLSASARDAQVVENRLVSLEDICRAFGVPLSVAGLGRNASYGSLTEEARALVALCLAPWARRIESQLSLALLSAEGRKSLIIEHDMTGLLRGDWAARMSAYKVGVEAGIFEPNECRAWESLAPLLEAAA
jgi:HK97 family phage portal protein